MSRTAAGNIVGYPERRREQRHTTLFRVGILHAGARRRLCVVRNMSPTGVKARFSGGVATGDRVELEMVPDRRIAGTIAWTDGASFGMDFDAPIDLATALAPPPQDDRPPRRMPRLALDRIAMIRVGADIVFVAARNLSQGGVSVSPADRIAVGDEVVVTLENLEPLKGIVRWRHDDSCGIVFNEPIPVASLARWLDKEA